MNKKVQEFIEKMKEIEKAKELKQREEHLISLGLIDEEKTKRGIVYLDNWDGTRGWKFDNEKNKYYKEDYVPAAIEVTDEEYQEILKYAPITTKKQEETVAQKGVANTIKTVAIIFAIINTIDILVLVFGTEWSELTNYYSSQIIGMIVARCAYFLIIPIIIGLSKIVAAAEKYLQK